MIDIIIPVFQAQSTLDRCLASIVMQTISDEVTVVLVNDHAAVENYSPFIERYGDVLNIRELTFDEPIGIGACRQAGIDQTDNEFFAFVDADDTLGNTHSLRHMMALVEPDTAVVSGRFHEYAADGTYFEHTKDMIWVFGKLYRRSFWKEHGIRFMSSSANEDTGVNAMISMLAKENEIVYSYGLAYIQHFNSQSITRQQNCRYTYDQNISGYADNMIRAIRHVRLNDPDNRNVERRVMYDICNLYKMHLETHDRAPQYLQNSWNAARRYYQAVFPQDKGIPFDLLKEEYDRVFYGDEFPMRGIIPYITLMDFIKNLALFSE